MSEPDSSAPGEPGIPPRWTSSAKTGVGTSLSTTSRVWFTLSHGILNEVYYPRVDQACIRDLGLIVTDGQDFFSEEKRHAEHQVAYLADGRAGLPVGQHLPDRGATASRRRSSPTPSATSCCNSVRFVPLQGTLDDYHLYVLLAPHLGNRGAATPPGSASTRACPCSLPSGQAPPWPWPAPCPG